MKVLLSIKPQFAELIFSGKKKFEFRRSIFKNSQVKTVVVYASSPTKKIIGEFEIDRIIKESIDNLWSRTKKHAGIDENSFYSYFDNKIEGYAIKIKDVKKYDKPLCIKKDLNLIPPQSFLYL